MKVSVTAMKRIKRIDFQRFDEDMPLKEKVNTLYEIVKEIAFAVDCDTSGLDLDSFSEYGLEQIDERIKKITEEQNNEAS